MVTAVAERSVRASDPAPGRRPLPAHWPFTALFLGFPLWWLLGLRTVLPMLVVVVMLLQLSRRRVLRVPPGFGIWLLFLAWVAIGALVLWADAPGAVPGGGSSRTLVFAYRLAWYTAATVFLLWVTNLSERELPSSLVHRLLGFMFVVTAAGGLLGVLLPAFEFTSPFEMMLPRGLRSNALIQSMTHPAAADIQRVLGYLQARPKAPFAFANSWGSNLSLFLPFFVAAAFLHVRRKGGVASVVGGGLVLVLAAIPVIYSLNRGLWASLALGAAGLGFLVLRQGRIRTIAVAGVLALVALVAFVASPLGTLFQERLDNQHSNDRRSQLLVQTVTSTASGSPIVGFGSTRDVQGSFASIAGASTPDCPACGVPPLGTQGHIWMVIFSQGFVGTFLFLAFFVLALTRCWRCRTLNETLCTFTLGFFFLQLLVYDTLGTPLITVMIAFGLVLREQATGRTTGRPLPILNRTVDRVRAGAPLFVVLMVLGAIAGLAWSTRQPVEYVARTEIQLRPYPTSLAEAVLDDPSPSESTLDTEAAILVSEASLGSVQGPADVESLRESIRVTAPPNTDLLDVELRSTDRVEGQRLLARVADSYLEQRARYLSQRRQQVLAMLRERQRQLQSIDVSELPVVRQESVAIKGSYQSREEAELAVEAAILQVVLTPTAAGEIVRNWEPFRVPPERAVPATSGAGLGLVAGAVVIGLVAEPLRLWPRRPRRKQRSPKGAR